MLNNQANIDISLLQHLAKKRHIAARKCSSPIAASHSARRAKRALPAQIPLSGMKADANPFDSYEAPGDEIVTSVRFTTLRCALRLMLSFLYLVYMRDRS